MKRNAKWATALLLSAGLAAAAPAADAPAPPPAPALDAHGDALPAGARARFGTLRWRHGGAVIFAAYSADGKGLLTASQDGSVRLWDADTGKELRRFGPNLQANMVVCGALDPKGEVFAVGSQDGSVTLYDVAAGKQLRQVKTNPAGGIAALVFGADGKSVFAKTYNHMIHQFDVAEGKEIAKINGQSKGGQQIFFNGAGSSTMALLDGGKTLASGAVEFDNVQVVAIVKLYDVATGKETGTIKGPTNGAQSLAFSPDGKTMAWGGGGGAVALWDVPSKKEVRSLVANRPNGFFANAVTFSPDGKTVAARNYDSSLVLWETATGKERLDIGGPSNNNAGFTGNLTYSADGRRLATGLGVNAVGQWDAGTGQPVGFQAGHGGAVLSLAASADGKTVVTRGGDNTVRRWDAATGKELGSFTLPFNTTHVSFSADGKTAASGGYDGVLHVWDVAAGTEMSQHAVQSQFNPNFMNLVISPDGKRAASRGYESAVRVWDLAAGREVRQLVEPPTVANGVVLQGYYYGGGHMAFSHDGAVLAVVSHGGHQFAEGKGRAYRQMNNVIRLWDVTTGKLLRQFDAAGVGVVAVAFSPDGRVLATGNQNGTVTLWETSSGKERFVFKSAAAGNVACLAFAPDGRFVAGATQNGGEVVARVWDARTGKELAAHTGHQAMVACLAFVGDGKALASGSHDSTALLWDAADLKPEPIARADVGDAQMETLWTDLAGADARKAYDALRTLGAAPRAAELLRDRLAPVPAPDAERVARLIADLDNNVFAVRHRATLELEKLGELAEPDLHRVLTDKPSLEIRQRIDRLLERLVTGQALPAEELRAARALEALELLGTPEAREVLQGLTKGAPGARLTRQAQVALDRLGTR